MMTVKQGDLLAIAIYLKSPVVPTIVLILVWAVLLIISAMFLYSSS